MSKPNLGNPTEVVAAGDALLAWLESQDLIDPPYQALTALGYAVTKMMMREAKESGDPLREVLIQWLATLAVSLKVESGRGKQ